MFLLSPLNLIIGINNEKNIRKKVVKMNFKAWNELHEMNRQILVLLEKMKSEISSEIESGIDSYELPFLKLEYDALDCVYQAKRVELGVIDGEVN